MWSLTLSSDHLMWWNGASLDWMPIVPAGKSLSLVIKGGGTGVGFLVVAGGALLESAAGVGLVDQWSIPTTIA